MSNPIYYEYSNKSSLLNCRECNVYNRGGVIWKWFESWQLKCLIQLGKENNYLIGIGLRADNAAGEYEQLGNII